MKLSNIPTQSEQEIRSGVIEYAINRTLFLSAQTHAWHWQTKSYAQHEALGEFYECLSGIVDALAESYMGSGGEFTTRINVSFEPFELENSIDIIRRYKAELTNLESQLMSNPNSFHGVGDTVVDLIKACDKVLYKFTLN